VWSNTQIGESTVTFSSGGSVYVADQVSDQVKNTTFPSLQVVNTRA